MSIYDFLTTQLHIQVQKGLCCNFIIVFIWYCSGKCSFLSLLLNPEWLLSACVILPEFFVTNSNIQCTKFTEYSPLSFNTSAVYYVKRHDILELCKRAKPTTPSILILWITTEQVVVTGYSLEQICLLAVMSRLSLGPTIKQHIGGKAATA